MKKFFIRLLSLMTIIAVVATFSTPIAHAQKKEEEENTYELARALEFIYEEAAVKDSNGEIIDIDIEMIEEKYGDDLLDEDIDLDDLKASVHQNSNSYKSDELNSVSPAMIMPPTDVDCMQKKLKEAGKGFIPSTVLSTIYAHLLDGEYLSAAKKLIKSGIKGSAAGIAAELSIIWYQCK